MLKIGEGCGRIDAKTHRRMVREILADAAPTSNDFRILRGNQVVVSFDTPTVDPRQLHRFVGGVNREGTFETPLGLIRVNLGDTFSESGKPRVVTVTGKALRRGYTGSDYEIKYGDDGVRTITIRNGHQGRIVRDLTVDHATGEKITIEL